MKYLGISFVIFCLIGFFLMKSGSSPSNPSEGSIAQTSQTQNQSVNETSKSEPTATDLRKKGTVKEQMDFIMSDARVTTNQYLRLVELLKTNEQEVLEYLSKLQYDEDLQETDPKYSEIEMIVRAMLVFYRDKPLRDNLEKVEIMRETGPLFSDVVSDLLFAGHGQDSAEVAYDWVMKHPDHPASLRSGATIGTILKDFAPEQAWDKIVQLPEGSIRSRAFAAILETSADQDIGIAIEQINSLEATPDLDESISNVLNLAMDRDYPYSELVSLATAPIDQNYRAASLTVLFENWARNDPSSLQEWSKKVHDFTPERMAEINLLMKQALQRHQ